MEHHEKANEQEERIKALEQIARRYQFLLSQFQMHSPDMAGATRYRFRNGGWPMTHFCGPTIEAAIDNAMSEVEREKKDTLANGAN